MPRTRAPGESAHVDSYSPCILTTPTYRVRVTSTPAAQERLWIMTPLMMHTNTHLLHRCLADGTKCAARTGRALLATVRVREMEGSY